MKKLLPFIALLSLQTFGQHKYQAYSEGTYGTSHLSNGFIDYLVYGGFIDSTLKYNASNQLSTSNWVSGYFEGGLQYNYKPDSLFGISTWSLFGKIKHTSVGRFDYSKDLFDLIFVGNQSFEGGSANLSMGLNLDRYNSYTVGLENEKHSYWIGLTGVQGIQFASIGTANSVLFTADNASYIELGLNANAHYSDTVQTNLLAGNGLGFALSAGISINNKLRIEVQDFGYIRWKKSSRSIKMDTIYHYDGFDVQDLIGGEIGFNNVNDTLGINSRRKALYRVLPFHLGVSITADSTLSQAVQPILEVLYIHRYHRVPEICAGIHYFASDATDIKAMIGVGGFFGVHFKGELDLHLDEKLSLKIGTRALFNSIGADGRGKSLYLGISGRL